MLIFTILHSRKVGYQKGQITFFAEERYLNDMIGCVTCFEVSGYHVKKDITENLKYDWHEM